MSEIQAIIGTNDLKFMLMINNETVQVRPSLSELKAFNSKYSENIYTIPNVNQIQNDSIIKLILSQQSYILIKPIESRHKRTTVTPLYICNQIELLTDEFTIYSTRILYIKKLDRVLYDGQFKIDDRNEQTFVRVLCKRFRVSCGT